MCAEEEEALEQHFDHHRAAAAMHCSSLLHALACLAVLALLAREASGSDSLAWVSDARASAVRSSQGSARSTRRALCALLLCALLLHYPPPPPHHHDNIPRLHTRNKNQVTCGSTIKLAHDATEFRLHSHAVSYSRGSQQQSVTAFPDGDDANSYWTVHGPTVRGVFCCCCCRAAIGGGAACVWRGTAIRGRAF